MAFQEQHLPAQHEFIVTLNEQIPTQVASQEQHLPAQSQTTTIRTSINGLGILSVSYALSQQGWLGILFLFLVASICYYTGILLQRCMESNPLIRLYPGIGYATFGCIGRYIVSGLLYLELHQLFPKVHIQIGKINLKGQHVFTVFPASIILPITWFRSLGLLAYVSMSGILASMVLLLSVSWIGVFGGIGFHQHGSIWKWNWSVFPTTLSMFTFCYAGHAMFPTLSNSMGDRKKFPEVLLFSFGSSTLIYGVMAILGYLMFGENVLSQITLNLPPHQITSKIAIVATLSIPITKYPIVLFPIATSLEQVINIHGNLLASIIIKTGLVVSMVVIALTIPFFDDVMNFIGAFASVTISVLLPCVCYLKIGKAYKKRNEELVLIGLIMLFGFFVCHRDLYLSG